MHLESVESGSPWPTFARDTLFVFVACACAGCAAERETRNAVSPLATPVQDAGAAQDPKTEQAAGTEMSDPAAPAVQTPDAAVGPAAQVADTSWVHGSLGARYRWRSNGDDRDNDAAAVLTLDIADPANPRVSGHLLARVDADLDGHSSSGAFQDLSDTYDESVVAKLYLAYADVLLGEKPESASGTLRVGRQSDPLLPEVLRMDGVAYASKPIGKDEIEFGLYGGVPVRLYDSSSDGDTTYGTFVEGAPWAGGRTRLDWMHLEDEELLGDDRNDLISLGLWQDLSPHWRVEGQYTHLEGDPRDLRLRAFYSDADSDTIVRIGYYELLETQTTRVTELDPFVEQLLDYFPFRETNLNVSQGVGENAVVDLGLDLRRVSDSSDVGEFNRDWERYYATGTLHDVSIDGLSLSLTVDRWDDDGRDTTSWGADLSYEKNKSWTAAVGTYYSLYKYHLLQLDERDDVRTYYVRATRDVSANLALDISYEYENDDLDDYNTLRVGALWRF